MRKSPKVLNPATIRRTTVFAWLFCMALFLTSSVSMVASAAQASVHSAHYVRRGHPISHKISKRRIVSRSAKIHRAALRRRKAGAASRARSQRLEARLDNIRTHTTPARFTPEENMTVEAARLPALAESAGNMSISGSVAQQPSPVQRDLPIFSSSIPRYMPIALRGSHEVLVHQNIIADVEGLSRIQNDSQLDAMVHSGDLVALPASGALVVDSRLPLNRRYCRPWTAKFLSDLSHAHESVFGRPLQLTSAVRTVDFQRHLARYNGNAAPAFGDTASPHLTGQAIDLGKKGMSLHEIAWMRDVLAQLQNSGKLDVEEEFEQACFHISVYKTYAPHSALPERLVATAAVPADDAQSEGPTSPAIGGLAQTVNEPVVRKTWVRRAHSATAHNVRHAVIHRRRRHRHSSMALLAARMR